MSNVKIHPTAIVDPTAQIGADVQIGPLSIIRPQVSIAERTTVQSHVVIEGEVANNVIIANNCLLAGDVCVDDGAFLGGGSTFHQHMHVGRLVMVQGSSAFGKDLPPFIIGAERNFVFGLNVVGLRRAGFSVKDRDEIKAAFKLIYLSGLNISQALEKAATMKFGAPAREFLDF